MTDSTHSIDKRSPGGIGKISAAIISAIIARHFIAFIEASYGTDFFQTAGISADLVKDTITGTLIGAVVGLTPQHCVAEVTSAIIFVKTTLKQWKDAWDKPTN